MQRYLMKTIKNLVLTHTPLLKIPPQPKQTKNHNVATTTTKKTNKSPGRNKKSHQCFLYQNNS